MSAIFVHVSDIHFGQERDHVVHIHDDVKKELVADAAEVIAGSPSGAAQGVRPDADPGEEMDLSVASQVIGGYVLN